MTQHRRDRTSGQAFGRSTRKMGAIFILATIDILGVALLDRWAGSQLLVRSIGRNSTEDQRVSLETNVSPNELPEVAWLMTFPNSGTTYTLKLIQQYTNTTTATNYGNEQSVHGTTIPVHPWLVNGPFLRHPTWQQPPRYILTKTHCGGTTISPSPEDYIETVRSFEIGCRSGNKVVNDTRVAAITYSMDVPKRAVHLIRNPFDVSIPMRRHLQYIDAFLTGIFP